MTNLASVFFQQGLSASEIHPWQNGSHPYQVRPNVREPTPTLEDAEMLLSAAGQDLAERIKEVTGKPHLLIVDRFFVVRHQAKAPQDEAIKVWTDLQSHSQKIGLGSSVAAVGLTLIAVWGASLVVEIALLVGIVAACCFAGWSLHRYHTAEKQRAVWHAPAEDFALRRKASLELSLEEMSKNKCHYHLEQSGGTLLGVEMFYRLQNDLKQFAEPLLKITCTEPQEQHQWLGVFFNSNPLLINFFQDNPSLLREKEWQDVQVFQWHIIQLNNLLKNLKDRSGEFDKIVKNQEKVEAKAAEVCKTLSLDATTTDRYQGLLQQALKEEYLSEIEALIQQHGMKAHFFGSLVYDQVRDFLEQACQGIVDQQPCTLDPTMFTNVREVIPKFYWDFEVIQSQYPQKVIVKAKSLCTEDAYQNFIDEIFKP